MVSDRDIACANFTIIEPVSLKCVFKSARSLTYTAPGVIITCLKTMVGFESCAHRRRITLLKIIKAKRPVCLPGQFQLPMDTTDISSEVNSHRLLYVHNCCVVIGNVLQHPDFGEVFVVGYNNICIISLLPMSKTKQALLHQHWNVSSAEYAFKAYVYPFTINTLTFKTRCWGGVVTDSIPCCIQHLHVEPANGRTGFVMTNTNCCPDQRPPVKH